MPSTVAPHTLLLASLGTSPALTRQALVGVAQGGLSGRRRGRCTAKLSRELSGDAQQGSDTRPRQAVCVSFLSGPCAAHRFRPSHLSQGRQDVPGLLLTCPCFHLTLIRCCRPVAGEYHQARAPGSDGPAYTFQGAAAPDPESLSLGPGAYNPQDPRPGGPAYTLRPKVPAYEEQPGKDSPGGSP